MSSTRGGSREGGHMGHDPSPLGSGAPLACQGHHRLIRGTTGLSGDHRPSRGTTDLAGAPQNFQGTPHNYLSGSPHNYLSGPPQTCQEHHRPSRGTSQRHHGPARDTTGLSGAPQACQRHHGVVRGRRSTVRNGIFSRAPCLCNGIDRNRQESRR